jgi:L-cysteine/cystine lyase
VRARAATLAAELADALAADGHDVTPRGRSTLVSWTVGSDADALAARDRLAGQGVILRDLPGSGRLRASVGAWNDERDLDRLLAAVARG